VIHATRAVMGSMRARRYGRIVNLASIAAIGTALSGNAFYAATKAEVVILTRRFDGRADIFLRDPRNYHCLCDHHQCLAFSDHFPRRLVSFVDETERDFDGLIAARCDLKLNLVHRSRHLPCLVSRSCDSSPGSEN
jgi:hypothetical protein